MKQFFILFIIVFAVACTSSTDKKPGYKPSDIGRKDDSMIALKINELLYKTFPKGNLKWSFFLMTDSAKQGASGVDSEPFNGEDNFYKDYASILRWSADSNYVLDLNSYGLIPVKDENGNTYLDGGDPEVGVGLIDRRSGNRIRLFYMGPHGGIYDGLWIDSVRVAFIGEVEDFASKNKKYDTLVWIYNRKDSIRKVYKLSR